MKFLPSMNLFRCQTKGTCLRMRGLCKHVSCKVSFKNRRSRNFCAARVKEDKHVCANPRRTPSVNTLFGEQVANLVTRLLKRFPFWFLRSVSGEAWLRHDLSVPSSFSHCVNGLKIQRHGLLWTLANRTFLLLHTHWMNQRKQSQSTLHVPHLGQCIEKMN